MDGLELVSDFSVLAPFGLAALAFCLSAAAIVVVRRNAERLGLVQIPNARSAHRVPVPAGGGIGIALGTLAAGLLVGGAGPIAVLLAAAVGLAIVGLIDDRRPLPALPRLVLQLMAVLAILAFPGGLGSLVGGFPPLLAVTLALAAILAGLWWLNLFNFMDGIDGLAGQQAIAMLLGIAALGWTAGAAASEPLWLLTVATFMAVSGFLAFNWPPARIMMGDAGSLFLGAMLLGLGLAAIRAEWMTLPQGLILAALFVTDATVTLVRRMIGRENILKAHNSHAYQVLARKWGGARPVTLLALAVNLLLLVPLALLAGGNAAAGAVTAILLYGVLSVSCVAIGAGKPAHG